MLTLITPPHMHFRVDVSFRAAMLPIMTVGEPGVHGAGVTGTHGAGVGVPMAAAVAAATAGFEVAQHKTNGMTLTIGLTVSARDARGTPCPEKERLLCRDWMFQSGF